MKFLDLLRLSTASLFKRKLRTILTILGVVIGVASIVVMVSLGLGLNRSYTEQIESYGGLTSIEVTDASNGMMYMGDGAQSSDTGEVKRLDQNAMTELLSLPNVKGVVPSFEINCLLKVGAYEGNVMLTGLPEGELEKQGAELSEGTFPTANGQMQVVYGNQVIAGFYNPKNNSGYWYDGEMPDIDLNNDAIFYILDQESYYAFQNGTQGGSETPVKPPKKYLFDTSGILSGSIEEYNRYSYNVYCDIDQLMSIVRKEFKGKVVPGQPMTSSGKPYKELYYSKVTVDINKLDNVVEVQNMIREMGYNAYSQAEWIESEQNNMQIIQLVLGGIGAVSLLVAAIGIANTMMMSIYERTKEIGIMKVLGCDMRNIQAMFLVEAGAIGLIGGAAGIILSYILSVIINVIAKSFMGDMGVTSGLSYIPAWLAVLSVVFAIFVGMLAGFFPSLRAMKLSPLAAIRNE